MKGKLIKYKIFEDILANSHRDLLVIGARQVGKTSLAVLACEQVETALVLTPSVAMTKANKSKFGKNTFVTHITSKKINKKSWNRDLIILDDMEDMDTRAASDVVVKLIEKKLVPIMCLITPSKVTVNTDNGFPFGVAEWAVECPSCKEVNSPIGGTTIEELDQVIKPDGVHCLYCGALLDSVDGFWTHPNAEAYRIPFVALPPDEIKFKDLIKRIDTMKAHRPHSILSDIMARVKGE